MKRIYTFLCLFLFVSGVAYAEEPTWVKMFRGVVDSQYSSSGVTEEDAFMFAEACVGYATQISGNREMAIRYLTAITGMSMSFVNGWTRKSEEDQNAYILDKYVYAIDRLNEEVSAGNTTWDKVEYLCSDMLSD